MLSSFAKHVYIFAKTFPIMPIFLKYHAVTENNRTGYFNKYLAPKIVKNTIQDQGCGTRFHMNPYRIHFSRWIRIRIRNTDPDTGVKKDSKIK
jgi:hypothetical protein